MKDYYQERAAVYERVYQYPERQAELRVLEQQIPCLFEDRAVLEVAAGTGYWTQFIVQTARSLLATDATAPVLAILQDRIHSEVLEVRQCDAYALDTLPTGFSGGFAGLWLSHVPKQQLNAFIASFHQRLSAGAQVVLLDNSRAQCERLPISHVDAFGNSYQDRCLDDGSVHRVLKNFPDEAELREMAGEQAIDFCYHGMQHFWWVEYRLG